MSIADLRKQIDTAPLFEPEQAEHTPTVWDHPLDLSDAILKPPEPITWFARDRIQQGRGHLITGIGGSSKTRLVYHLAIGASTGRLPWDWTIQQRGRSVLVLTEDIAADAHRAVYHTCAGLGLDEAARKTVGRDLILYPLAGTDVLLLEAVDRSVVKSAAFHALVEKVRTLGDVAFIALDPALSLSAGDELDQAHQRALGKMADDLAVQTGAAVCLIAHATKASLNRDELDSHNSRGGGAITDAVRAEYAMRTMTPKEGAAAGISDVAERKRHVQLVATKGNHLPPEAYAPIWLRRGEHGVLAAADVVLDVAKARGPSQKAMAALDVLLEMQEEHTPTLAEWRAECVNRGIVQADNDTAIKKAHDRLKHQLHAAGLIKPGLGRGIWQAVKGT